jgi:hypothetical protein
LAPWRALDTTDPVARLAEFLDRGRRADAGGAVREADSGLRHGAQQEAPAVVFDLGRGE